MDRSAFVAQDDPTRPLVFIRSRQAQAALDVWDQVFALNFFEYRAALRDIAWTSVVASGADDISVGFDDFDSRGFDGWWNDSTEEVVVALDDDDFLRTNIAQISCAFDAGTDVVLWPAATLRVENGGSLAWRPHIIPCVASANCAVRKSFLTSHFEPADGRVLLSDHRTANERIADVLGIGADQIAVRNTRSIAHERVRIVPECFSLHNEHAGSIMFLIERAMTSPDPARFLRGIDFTIPRPIPDYASSLERQLDALERLGSAMRRGT